MRTPSIDHSFLGSVVAVAVLNAALHALSARPELSWMWGAHFYLFYPPWILYLATALLAVVVVAAGWRPERVTHATVSALTPILAKRRFSVTAVIALFLGTALLWTARICHTYLGDGNIIVSQIDSTQGLHERQPLSSLLQYAVYRITKPWFASPDRTIERVAQEALARGSVLAGCVFLVLAWFLACEIARLRATKEDDDLRAPTALLWLVIVLQGYVQLFFGYVENYSFCAVGVAAYGWLALRAIRGASPLLLPTLALMLCIALQLSSLVLGLSFLVLVAQSLFAPERRARALRDLAVAVGVTVLVGLGFGKLREGYNPLATLFEMVGAAFVQDGNRGYMFSAGHVRDFFNEQLLIGPLGMLFFVPAAVFALFSGEKRRPATWFFLVGGFGYLAACWLIEDVRQSYARDWDLLSQSGIVFTTAALGLFLLPRARDTAVVAALVCAIAVSAYHTVPWIATNANEERSLARLETLPLGPGQTKVLLSTWFRQRGDVENQRHWLQQAAAVSPPNLNALWLLAMLDYETGRYDEAVTLLNQAIQLRPDKQEFRVLLVQALNALNRPVEAIPHLIVLSQADSTNASLTVTLGEAFAVVGRPEEARAAFARAERIGRRDVERRPGDSQANLTYGVALYRCGRTDEAIVYLEKTLALDPRSKDGPCFLGLALRDGGRDAEAAASFQACLQRNPAFPGRVAIERWLAAQQYRPR